MDVRLHRFLNLGMTMQKMALYVACHFQSHLGNAVLRHERRNEEYGDFFRTEDKIGDSIWRV